MAFILTKIGNIWIERLFSMPDAPLSFPEEKISRSRFRQPLLAIFLFACMFRIFDANFPEIFYLTAAVFILLLATLTDFEQYVIFNRMLAPLALLGFLRIMHFWLPVGDFLVASIGGGIIFLLIAIITHGGIGGGDIKLIAALGLWFGTEKLISIVTIGLILGGVAAILFLIFGRKNRKSFFAYGPYFTLTAIYFLCDF